MFSIAPHGKTIIALLPYTHGEGPRATLTQAEGREAGERLKGLVDRFRSPDDAEERTEDNLTVSTDGGTVEISARFAPHVLEGGASCQIYITLPQAEKIANRMLAAGKTPTVRKRTRSAPGAPIQVRKRTRKNG